MIIFICINLIYKVVEIPLLSIKYAKQYQTLGDIHV